MDLTDTIFQESFLALEYRQTVFYDMVNSVQKAMQKNNNIRITALFGSMRVAALFLDKVREMTPNETLIKYAPQTLVLTNGSRLYCYPSSEKLLRGISGDVVIVYQPYPEIYEKIRVILLPLTQVEDVRLALIPPDVEAQRAGRIKRDTKGKVIEYYDRITEFLK